MRLLLLSRSAALYSTSRLVRAARARGHDIDVVDPFDLHVGIGAVAPVAYRGLALPRYDVVVPRFGTTATDHGVTVLEALARDGVPSMQAASAIACARDKVQTLTNLAEAKLRIPRTLIVRGVEGLRDAATLLGGFPLVVKLAEGSQGVGTMLAESQMSLVPMVETMLALGQRVVVQEFITGSRGRDLRVIVGNGTIVAAMERRAARGEFRANMHRGGRGRRASLRPAQRRLALAACEAVGLEVAGVDLVVGRGRSYVIEVNASPGLEGIEEVTQIDVAGAIVASAERCARPGASRS